jgi:hypothetical protein
MEGRTSPVTQRRKVFAAVVRERRISAYSPDSETTARLGLPAVPSGILTVFRSSESRPTRACRELVRSSASQTSLATNQGSPSISTTRRDREGGGGVGVASLCVLLFRVPASCDSADLCPHGGGLGFRSLTASLERLCPRRR